MSGGPSDFELDLRTENDIGYHDDYPDADYLTY